MKNKIICLTILGIMLLSVVSADVIIPGFSPIPINNYITNLDESSNYVFISVGEGPMCNLDIISEGVIQGQYKFCSISVYAISKDNFNEENLPTVEYGEIEDEQSVKDYLNDVGAIKVIEDVEHYKEVSTSSSQKEINNYYEIDLEKVKVKPTSTDIKYNYLLYVYIILPITAILLIVFIIRRRE